MVRRWFRQARSSSRLACSVANLVRMREPSGINHHNSFLSPQDTRKHRKRNGKLLIRRCHRESCSKRAISSVARSSNRTIIFNQIRHSFRQSDVKRRHVAAPPDHPQPTETCHSGSLKIHVPWLSPP